MKAGLILLTTLQCAFAFAGPSRPISSSTFQTVSPCGPAWDSTALQGQWFRDPTSGATNASVREYHDDDDSLTIAGTVQNITFSQSGNTNSNIIAFDILAVVSNSLPADYSGGSASNSHGEVQTTAGVTSGGDLMQQVRITAEFALADTNMIPAGNAPPYWPDPLSAGAYHIVAANEHERAWYCWTPGQQAPNLPAGNFQVPSWTLTPFDIPAGSQATVLMQFTVSGTGMPLNDYRHSVIRASQQMGLDVLYNRHTSLKISHWLDTLLVDNGAITTPNPPWWEGEEEFYVYASDASVFYNGEEEPEVSHKMHWPQLPDPNGWDVRACNGADGFQKVLADDFRCTASGPITNIIFWGSWYSDEFDMADPYQGITNIHLSIHKDIPDPDPQNPDTYSMPELPALMEWNIDPHNLPQGWTVEITPEKPSMQGWYDPNQGEVIPDNHTNYFRYDVVIPTEEAFVQTSNDIYWLDVSVETTSGQWGWKTTTNHWNDDAVWADRPVSDLAQWQELYEPPQFEQSLDLAFIIDGPKEAEPVDEYDWGDAPDPAYPTLAANSGANHLIGTSLYLGTAIDAEPNGQPSANAKGDDTDAGGDDEDGVTFKTPFFPGSIAQIDVTAVGSGLLNVWIDFNVNGSWLDSGEQVYTDLSLSSGTTTLTVPVPTNAVPATKTYMRVRYSSIQSLPPTGYASDGEVEDYLIAIEEEHPIDWGDLPDPGYPVLYANNGAHHILSSSLFLGTTVDSEPDGQQTINADGDDTNLLYPGSTHPPGDEDGVTLTCSALMPGGYASVDVIASQPGTLDAWIDFNLDNSWVQTGDQIFSAKPLIQGTNSLLFPVPLTASTGIAAHSRFRITSGASAYPGGTVSPAGLALDGEVEDYHWLISPVPSGNDWGDAMDPSYPTLTTSVGASHPIVAGVLLGATIDAEMNGAPRAAADGDDTTGIDDEDGVTFTSAIVAGTNAAIQVVAGVSGGYLDAWIDFNTDGDWTDSGEQIASATPLAAGLNTLSVPVPQPSALGPTYARFRITSASVGLNPDNSTIPLDGEVEDYLVNLYQPQTSTNIVITNLYLTASNTIARIEWNAESNIAYQVQSSSNLLTNIWINVGGSLMGPINWQTNSTAPTQQFYRITAPWTQ